MKFCQRLREQSQIFASDAVRHVLDYKKLKKRITRMRQTNTTTAADVAVWFKQFLLEVRKFDEYLVSTYEDCEAEVDKYEYALQKKKPIRQMQLKDAYVELQELRFFQELNQTAVRKILKKFDKNIPGHNLSAWRVEASKLAAFKSNQLCELTLRVTSVYAALFRDNRAKLAEMELDYHVNCVSDIFSFMISYSAKPLPPSESIMGMTDEEHTSDLSTKTTPVHGANGRFTGKDVGAVGAWLGALGDATEFCEPTQSSCDMVA